jgi:predicted O-methyltransferase YrrM
MSAESKPSNWGASYRLIAAEKWKSKSAAMGRGVTQAIVELARPAPGMKALDLASGTGEPAISIAKKVGDSGHVVALDLSSELLEIAKQRAAQRDLAISRPVWRMRMSFRFPMQRSIWRPAGLESCSSAMRWVPSKNFFVC